MKRSKPSTADNHGTHKAATLSAPNAASLRGASELFKAMGDVERLRLLELLKHGERCVSEIVETMGDKFSTVSQRLRILRDEGLITRRRRGQHLYYALADRHVADLIQNALAHADELFAAPAHDDEGD
jgi:ArsR family transcriptional regulator, lead/cadmium/zinc/bismuth-responsive transcriptional repressor